MKTKQMSIAAVVVLLGFLMIAIAFVLLDSLPYINGSVAFLVQTISMVTFIGGALVISKGLPF